MIDQKNGVELRFRKKNKIFISNVKKQFHIILKEGQKSKLP
jgi:hypothetical protein